MSYQNILIAVDLTEDSEAVARQGMAVGRQLAGDRETSLHLLHVVEYLPVDPAGEAMMPPPVNMEEDLTHAARERLDALAEKLELPDCRRHVRLGNIKAEVNRLAEELEADLIVLGSHERHGFALLLGSTEKSVLSAAPCDVLAVRLRRS